MVVRAVFRGSLLERVGGLAEGVIPGATNLDSSCPRLSRVSTSCFSCKIKDVDGRDKPGHDGGDASSNDGWYKLLLVALRRIGRRRQRSLARRASDVLRLAGDSDI